MYETRQKRKSNEPIPKSRVDWKRTKVDISHILDSDESSSTSIEEEEQADSSSSSDVENEDQLDLSGCTADDGEDKIRKPRQRNRSTALESSGSSSDSDGPGLRILVRRRRVIAEDDDCLNRADDGESSEVNAQAKKQKRNENLKQLVEKRRSRNSRASWETDEASSSNEYIPLTPDTTGEEEEDSQEMKDFIEEDEEEDQEDEDGTLPSRYQDLFVRHKISQFTCNDLYTHLQKVINALLINIADKTFLDSLYDGIRKKRYAKDMLKSLDYLDGRVLDPRLGKLMGSCRWKTRYKERVDSYPQLHTRVVKAEEQSCDACELFRYCKYVVTLSGQAYDNETLEIDDFLPEDKQWLTVGATCGHRTQVYHRIKHYKFHLYQRCIPFLQESEEHSVKEMVEMALSKMEKEKFIQKEMDRLQRYVDAADTFQEEKEDSLIS